MADLTRSDIESARSAITPEDVKVAELAVAQGHVSGPVADVAAALAYQRAKAKLDAAARRARQRP